MAELEKNIERKINKTFGFTVNVIIRTDNELKTLLRITLLLKI